MEYQEYLDSRQPGRRSSVLESGRRRAWTRTLWTTLITQTLTLSTTLLSGNLSILLSASTEPPLLSLQRSKPIQYLEENSVWSKIPKKHEECADVQFFPILQTASSPRETQPRVTRAVASAGHCQSHQSHPGPAPQSKRPDQAR